MNKTQKLNSCNLQDFGENRGNSAPHQYHSRRPSRGPSRSHRDGANSIKLDASIFFTLTIRRRNRKETYELITRASRVRLLDRESNSYKPPSPTNLVRYFRSLAKKGLANRYIHHKNGVVERWDENGYGRYDPREEQRQIRQWIREHLQESA